MDEHTYDVALWRFWPRDVIPYADCVSAPSPLVAALRLMACYNLRHVSRVAVGLPDGSVWRKEQGLSRYVERGEPQADAPRGEQDEVEEGVMD